jgi:hypothetical protein
MPEEHSSLMEMRGIPPRLILVGDDTQCSTWPEPLEGAMGETGRDHDVPEPQVRPWWRRPAPGGWWLLGIVITAVITTVLPETMNAVSVVVAGLGLLAAARH